MALGPNVRFSGDEFLSDSALGGAGGAGGYGGYGAAGFGPHTTDGILWSGYGAALSGAGGNGGNRGPGWTQPSSQVPW